MSLIPAIEIKRSRASRVGRGISAGQGKTAGRGTKGQKSRTGYNLPRRFEGGQTSLISRLPKRKGFRGASESIITVSTKQLDNFKTGDIVSPKTLFSAGIINSVKDQVKVVGGELKNKKLRFHNVSLSKSMNTSKPTKTASKDK